MWIINILKEWWIDEWNAFPLNIIFIEKRPYTTEIYIQYPLHPHHPMNKTLRSFVKVLLLLSPSQMNAQFSLFVYAFNKCLLFTFGLNQYSCCFHCQLTILVSFLHRSPFFVCPCYMAKKKRNQHHHRSYLCLYVKWWVAVASVPCQQLYWIWWN